MRTRPSVSIVVPAWNEERSVGQTLQALHRMTRHDGSRLWDELIVVDDGSSDRTAEEAAPWATTVIEHAVRLGKGAAMRTGWSNAAGDIILFADADLESSAEHLAGLLSPILNDEADMSIAAFSGTPRGGGFGIVRRIAGRGIFKLTGQQFAAPLSGQRAVRSEVLKRLERSPQGFGIEVGLTIDAARLGYRICEVPLPLSHRETGRTIRGFWHRGGQLAAIAKTMWLRRGRFVP
ncbi:glycosyltransferase family 2 protein [Paenibacillus sp. GYB004]|uniref:glycosyltransferase family 2 protein n=1 Tax=Paenibacillus sp. GYB004 TaxID=2994393 RepID=UPI002F969666